MDVSLDMHESDSKMNRNLNSDNDYTGTYNHSILSGDRLDSSRTNDAFTQSQSMDRDAARRVLDTKTYISQKVDRNLIRGCQSIKTCANKLVLASWNVEGLTDAKIISLQQTMIQQSIDILAIQETHRRLSDYWVTSEGFLIILSGRSDEQRESAGVGFIVSPALRSSILGFCQATSRYTCLKVRSSGGKIAIVSAYAPQSGRPFEERFSFFQDLLHFWKSISSHGPKFLLGDFNARLYQQFAGEEEIFGSFYVKNQRQ